MFEPTWIYGLGFQWKGSNGIYCSGISQCTYLAQYQLNILFRNIPVQHNYNGIYCLLFRNIPVYMLAQYQWNILFRNIPVYIFSTIPMEYIVYCSGIFLSTCSALYRWNILFTVQEYSCLHVQHYTDGI